MLHSHTWMFRSGASQRTWSRQPPPETPILPISSHHTSGNSIDGTVAAQPPVEQQQQYQQYCLWQPSAGSNFDQAARQFLHHQHLTDTWLPYSTSGHHRSSPGDLVGTAAQACQELAVPSVSAAHARASTFTDRLRSDKVQSLCTF